MPFCRNELMYITQKAITKNGKKKAQGRLSYSRTISPEPKFDLHGFFSNSSRIELYYLYIRSITYINQVTAVPLKS